MLRKEGILSKEIEEMDKVMRREGLVQFRN
jgi:hypothetical protein